MDIPNLPDYDPNISFDAWVKLVEDFEIGQRTQKRSIDGYGVPVLHLHMGHGTAGAAILAGIEGGDQMRTAVKLSREMLAKHGLKAHYMGLVVDLSLGVRPKEGPIPPPGTPLSSLPLSQRMDATVIVYQSGADVRWTVWVKLQDVLTLSHEYGIDNKEIKELLATIPKPAPFLIQIPEQFLPPGMKEDLTPLYDPSDVPPGPTTMFRKVISDVL